MDIFELQSLINDIPNLKGVQFIAFKDKCMIDWGNDVEEAIDIDDLEDYLRNLINY